MHDEPDFRSGAGKHHDPPHNGNNTMTPFPLMSPSHTAFDVLNVCLAILYGILGVVGLFQLAQIVYYKHKIRSFHSVFLVHVVLFATLRTIFFLCEEALESDDFGFFAMFRFVFCLKNFPFLFISII
jgi:hypothetical protein